MDDRHSFRFSVTLNMGDYESCTVDYNFASDAQPGESADEAYERVASYTINKVMEQAKQVRNKTRKRSSEGGY